mgnify:FL=1
MAIIMSCSSSAISNLYEAEIPTENNPLILPSRRKIYRHSTLPGSVLEFYDIVSDCRIVILDAEYRSQGQYGYTSVNPENMSPTGELFDPLPDMANYPNILDTTITKLNLWDDYAVNLTNKLTTNIPTEEFNKPTAAIYCKSLTFTENSKEWQCSLPTIAEVLRISLEYVYIDQLDPTIANHPTLSMHSIFHSAPNQLLSSSFYNNGNGWGVYYRTDENTFGLGNVPGAMKCNVVPIIELMSA